MRKVILVLVGVIGAANQAVADDLIVNGDFELGRTGFVTDYIFSSGNTERPGRYDLTTDPGQSHPAPDDPSYGDHTTGSGLMMAANGARYPDVVAWSQQVEVEPNTPYAFSAWISNWARDGRSPAELDFRFDGTSVGTLRAPDAPANWTEFATTWFSEGNTSVEIQVVDRNLNGNGNDFALDDISLNVVPEPSSIAQRRIFYNNSAYDSVGDLTDDDAIAPDKQALLPGQTATFDNYTSFSHGINGIMVDVTHLPDTPTIDDFEFRIGNDTDPDDWDDAPDPSEITVRPGEGEDGSDRISIIWPDNAIQKQWLQVTMLANENTGLTEDDVFYFGNAIGEIGNSDTDAKVNAFDMLGARDNQRNWVEPALIDFPFDFDRDGRVNATDMLIARDNTTHFLNALQLITVPGGKGTVPEPSALVLLGIAGLGLLGWRWWNRKA